MDDEEDVRKMIELVKQRKLSDTDTFLASDSEEEYDEDEYDQESYPENDILRELKFLNSEQPQTSETLPLTLRNEEQTIIDACQDAELKRLLILNRSKRLKLIKFHKLFKDLLIESQTSITEKCAQIQKLLQEKVTVKLVSKMRRLAAPYFKDADLYPCPRNCDAKRKKLNNEISVYEFFQTRKWSNTQCDQLLNAVKTNYSINKETAIKKKLIRLNAEDNVDSMEVSRLHAELENLKINNVPELHSDEYIDWYRIADVFMKEKHSYVECRSFWNLYVHPQINKSSWSESEFSKLTEVVQKHNYQNWAKIAEELGTNRSAFSVCQYYFNRLPYNIKKGDFTPEEDKRLLQLIEQYKVGKYIQWIKVAHHFPSRSRAQLFYRYTYYLNNSNQRKIGKFSEAEDILLMILVGKFGKNYGKCAKYFPNRSQVQLKSRYSSHLQNALRKGCFTLEDDLKIMDYAEQIGTKQWSGLKKILQRNPGQIRQRHGIITQFLKDNPDKQLVDVPRRKHNYKKSEIDLSIFKQIADSFKDKPIPTLESIEKILKTTAPNLTPYEDSEEDISDSELRINNIDDLLTEFFSTTIMMDKKDESQSQVNCAQNILAAFNTVLEIFKVQLDLPTDFRKERLLDSTDHSILEGLSKIRRPLIQEMNTTNITTYIAPNINNLVCLRALLIKYLNIKNSSSKDQENSNNLNELFSEVSWGVNKFLVSLPDFMRVKIKQERNLFLKRLVSLLNWPSILSLHPPKINVDSGVVSVKRTYSRMKQVSSEPNNKKAKITSNVNENVGQDIVEPSTSRDCVKDELIDMEDVQKLDRLLASKIEYDSDSESDDS